MTTYDTTERAVPASLHMTVMVHTRPEMRVRSRFLHATETTLGEAFVCFVIEGDSGPTLEILIDSPLEALRIAEEARRAHDFLAAQADPHDLADGDTRSA